MINVRWEDFEHKRKNFVAKMNVIIKFDIHQGGTLLHPYNVNEN